MQQLPVFVYGTLRPGGGNYRWALAGRIRGHQDATLNGATMFAGPGFPYVVDGDGTVVGSLIDLDPGHYLDVMGDLDRLEGYHETGVNNHYDRAVRTVDTTSGPVKAWVYLAARPGRLARRIDSGDWHAAAPVPA